MDLSESDVKTLVQELIDNAKRLGLIWEIRPGTVASFAHPNLYVRLDGDDTALPCTSLVGHAGAGSRVYVFLIPPAGAYAFPVDQGGFPVTHIATIEQSDAFGSFTARSSIILGSADVVTNARYRFISFFQWSTLTNADTVAQIFLYVAGDKFSYTKRLPFTSVDDPETVSFDFTHTGASGNVTVALDISKFAGTGTLAVPATLRQISLDRIG